MATTSTPRGPAGLGTRDRLLAAATAEFASRGFDGAKVDRIATRARVNKAMLYYHFHSKTALYQTILLDQFGRVASAVAAVPEKGGAPEAQLHAFIQAVAEEVLRRPLFPPLWLREVADGGRHLSPAIVGELRRIVETLAIILERGRATGVFRAVNPFVTQIGIVAPLLVFAAAGPIRERFRKIIPTEVAGAGLQLILGHVLTATLAAVVLPPDQIPVAGPSPRRQHS